jgi:hypothetical protein
VTGYVHAGARSATWRAVVAPPPVIAGFYSRIGAVAIGINMLFAIGPVHGAESARYRVNDRQEGRSMNLQQAMKNPNVVFASPEVLEASTELTAVQKRAILTQWKDQLEKLLIADEESMLRAGVATGANADCLRRVTNILTRLPT